MPKPRRDVVTVSVRVRRELRERLIAADTKQEGWTVTMQNRAEADLDRQDAREKRGATK